MPCAFHADRPYLFPSLGSGCQFGVAEEELVRVDSRDWCHFHLPLETVDKSPTEKTRWNGERIAQFNERIFAFIKKAKKEGKAADLTGVVFPGDISFEGFHSGESTFPDVCFFKAHFGDVARFRDTHFGGLAVFHKAHFGEVAGFPGARFEGGAFFGGVPEGGPKEGGAFEYASFPGATFEAEADFSDRRFQKATDFSDCVFHEAPRFHNSRLHQDTDFTGAEFLDFESGGAARAYRTLKLAMENVRAWDEAGMFFAHEQKSRRHEAETPWAVKAFSLLYQITADYGRSFALPLAWLMGAAAAFFLVYLAGFTGGEPTWEGAAEAASFTLRQIVRPFDALASTPAAESGMNPLRLTLGLRALAALHSLLSLAFVALFLVALRRRFKMG